MKATTLILAFFLCLNAKAQTEYSLNLHAFYDITPKFGVIGMMEDDIAMVQASLVAWDAVYFYCKLGVTVAENRFGKVVVFPLFVDVKFNKGLRTPYGFAFYGKVKQWRYHLGFDLSFRGDYSISVGGFYPLSKKIVR
jgi:hypothetical protein